MSRLQIKRTLLIVALCIYNVAWGLPQGTGFTYQGELVVSGVPADGEYDFSFRLYKQASDGLPISLTPAVIQDVPVNTGGFTVELDFGAVFSGDQLWLEIAVRDGASTGAYTTLQPRQKLTSAPYALFAQAGNEGPQGPVGETGPQGLQGLQGPPGDSRWQLNGNIAFYDAGSVGIGTSNPGALLGASGDAEQKAIYGHHTGTSGTAFGIYGESLSSHGRGVFGQATATSGATYGGYFVTNSDNINAVGVRGDGSWSGIFGYASNTLGEAAGVRGTTNSPAGSGVSGYNPSNSGAGAGVLGVSNGADASGVWGQATHTSGVNFGVQGISDSTSGRGVFGQATATTGTTYGGYFISNSNFGSAVGVRGEGLSTGVSGKATRTSGFAVGVLGYVTEAPDGTGVKGQNTNSTGGGAGVMGTGSGVNGRGVYGIAYHSSGVNFGVQGESYSTLGRGVSGYANETTGIPIGVYAVSNSPTGYDFYADGAGVNYGGASSRRWKSNIVPIDDPLGKIARINGVYFDWDVEHGGHHDLGMIAEEVGEVMPEIVVYEENGIDANGMDYSKVTPLLVEAVKALRVEYSEELSSLRTEKDAEIAELRGMLADLQRLVEQLMPEN